MGNAIEAIQHVLADAGEPLHYKEIAQRVLARGLWQTDGKTPEATMYGSVLEETQRYRKRGEQPRFHMHGKGMIGLLKSLPTGIPAQIEKHNCEVRRRLHERLLAMPFGRFEDIVGTLLAQMGFVEVAVTRRTNDGGIDVRGTLVVGDSVRIRMAVQVKRWKKNVQSPVVQQVRGSLGTHEQGLIITTSDFSLGARSESARPDATPVGLMNGHQLLNLLLEHEIGVQKTAFDLFTLVSEDFRGPET